MRAKRRWPWFALGAAGLTVLAACGGGGEDDEAGVARRDGAATTTSSISVGAVDHERTTSTSPPATAISVGPLPAVVLVDGIPQVKVTPTRATVGTRVQIDGYGFEGVWQRGGSLWLSDGTDGECGLLAETDADLDLGVDGHLTGSFVVPETGVCRFSSGAVVNLAGGHLDLTYRCSTDCRIGRFTVILPGESTEDPTGVPCDTVNFGGGENVAGEVFADGVSCDEAESFLRANAAPLGPVNGPAHLDAEGFSCDRTGQSDVHLPRANYKCTRGSQTIFFIRT